MLVKKNKNKNRWKNWLKFFTGLAALIALIFLLSSGFTLPGFAGKVLRHNMENNIDATPLIYSDHDSIFVYQEKVRSMKEKGSAAKKLP